MRVYPIPHHCAASDGNIVYQTMYTTPVTQWSSLPDESYIHMRSSSVPLEATGGHTSDMEASNELQDDIEDPVVVSDICNAVNSVAGSVDSAECMVHLCEGFSIVWTAVFQTFPWQIFEDSNETLGFLVFFFH